jgi:hypothetical protein
VLRPPLQGNYEEQDWFWFDMLHYRGTGDFIRALITAAATTRRSKRTRSGT